MRFAFYIRAANLVKLVPGSFDRLFQIRSFRQFQRTERFDEIPADVLVVAACQDSVNELVQLAASPVL